MIEVLKCNKCGHIWDKPGDVEFAKKQANAWAMSRKAEGKEPQGLVPCPYYNCDGEMVIHKQGDT